MNVQNGGQQNQNNNKQAGLSWSAPQKPVVPAAAPAPAPKIPAPATKPVAITASSNGNTAKIAGWLAAGIVAGVLLAWGGTSLIRGSAPATESDTLQDASSTTPGTDTGVAGSLGVADPQKAGRSVAIAKVAVSEPTWVVVYESRDGKPGNVLGAAIVTPGQQSATVELLRGTLAGQTYFVTEQSDNGDRKFSLKEDVLLTVGGEPLWVTFTAN